MSAAVQKMSMGVLSGIASALALNPVMSLDVVEPGDIVKVLVVTVDFPTYTTRVVVLCEPGLLREARIFINVHISFV